MQSLLRFIINNQFILLFFLLEIFAITLVVNNNEYHKSEYLILAQQVSGKLSKKRENLVQYLSLKDRNQQLIAENLALKNQLEEFKSLKNDIKLPGNILPDTRYQYISARVINNSVNKQYNYITIDKGLKDGIEPEMAVIASDGAVGVVSSVSENYAIVISLLNRNLKVSAKFKKNSYFGSFEWSGKNYRTAVLNEIPLHVDVNKSDTIVTSGFSVLFPEGVALATVEDFYIRSGTFFTINLQLTTDFKQLDNVYVVKDNKKAEQLKIENIIKND
jgi:rod shape-determining protein MreC